MKRIVIVNLMLILLFMGIGCTQQIDPKKYQQLVITKNDLENQVGKLKRRVKEQETALKKQENTLKEQETALKKQENTLKEQETALKKQENTLKEQEAAQQSWSIQEDKMKDQLLRKTLAQQKERQKYLATIHALEKIVKQLKPPVPAVDKIKNYKIVTGKKGFTYYQFGQDLSKYVTSEANIKLEVQSTNGSVENVKLLKEAKGVKFALVQSDVHSALLTLSKKNKKIWNRIKDLRAILPLYFEEMHFIVRADSDMKYIHEIEDKRISIGSKGSGTALTGNAIYRLLFDHSIPTQQMFLNSYDEAIEQLYNQKIDVILVIAGQPTPQLDLPPSAKNKIKLLSFAPDHPAFEKITQKYPQRVIRANLENSYKWLDNDVHTFGVKTILATFNFKGDARKALEDFTHSLCANFGKLQKEGHKKWKEVTLSLTPLPGKWEYYQPAKNILDKCPVQKKSNDQKTENYRIVTGKKGFTYYQFGQNLSEYIGPDSNIKLEVQSTNGSVENMKLLKERQDVQFALVQSDVYNALLTVSKKNKKIWNRIKDVRVVLPLYFEEMHFIVRADSNMEYVHQIKDKKISIGSKGSGTALTGNTIYRLMFDQHIPHQQMVLSNYEEAIDQLSNQEIDVVLVVAGQPTPQLNLPESTKSKIKLLSFASDHPTTIKVAQEYTQRVIRANQESSYKWLNNNVHTFGVKTFLVTNNTQGKARKSQEQFAHSVCENFNQLQKKGHKKWKEVSLTLTTLPGKWKYHEPSKNILNRCKKGTPQ